MGGMLAAIESGYIGREIQEASIRLQRAVESGERVIVGLNKFQDEGEAEPAGELFESDPEVEARQRTSLSAVKAKRDAAAVHSALAELAEVIRRDENVMPCLIQAVKAYASVGEITAVMRKAWGEYRPRIHV